MQKACLLCVQKEGRAREAEFSMHKAPSTFVKPAKLALPAVLTSNSTFRFMPPDRNYPKARILSPIRTTILNFPKTIGTRETYVVIIRYHLRDSQCYSQIFRYCHYEWNTPQRNTYQLMVSSHMGWGLRIVHGTLNVLFANPSSC